jgi:hypothetical protein
MKWGLSVADWRLPPSWRNVTSGVHAAAVLLATRRHPGWVRTVGWPGRATAV